MLKIQNLSTPVTAAIIGLGRAGWDLHVKPMLEHKGFRIIAVADPMAERGAEAKQATGCESFANIDELLAKSDARLVAVATPSISHYEDALKVLNAGRHCIVEKPFTLEYAQAKELVSLARKKRLGLFVNHSHLHMAEYYHLKGVIESGILGDLYSIRASWGFYSRRLDWQTLKKNGGGQLNNTCPHTLSIVIPLLGSRVQQVFADLRNIKDLGDAEDHVHVVLKSKSGVTADVVVSSAMALPAPRWMLCGSRGALTSDGKMSKIRYYDGSKVTPASIVDAAAPGRQYLSESLPWEEKELPVDPAPVESFHENVFNVLTAGAKQIVTPESAMEVVRVSCLARKSAA